MNKHEDKFVSIVNIDAERRILTPIDPACYNMTVSEFIEVVEDAKTHGMTVLYLDGKLYYTYNTL